MIYPVDSAIQPLNNQGLESKGLYYSSILLLIFMITLHL